MLSLQSIGNHTGPRDAPSLTHKTQWAQRPPRWEGRALSRRPQKRGKGLKKGVTERAVPVAKGGKRERKVPRAPPSLFPFPRIAEGCPSAR